MGASTSVYEPNGQLKPYPYPYNPAHKLWQFPWKFYFTHSKVFRGLSYGVILGGLTFFKLQTIVRSKANRQMWKENRKHYEPTFFDPPGPPNYKL